MTSRLSQMQARFQQKQMQEKEEKLLKLYENQQQRAFDRVGRGSAGSNGSITTITTGKVRQMFDERRQKAGIDRSYPLEPLKNNRTNRATSLDRKAAAPPVAKTAARTSVQKVTSMTRNGKPMINKREYSERFYNNNGEEYDEGRYRDETDNYIKQRDIVALMNDHNLSDNLDDEEMPRIGFDDYDDAIFTGKLANVGGKLPSQHEPPKQPAKKVTSNWAAGSRANVVRKEPAPNLKNSPKAVKPSFQQQDLQQSATTATTLTSEATSRTSSRMSSRTTPAGDRVPSTARPSSKPLPRQANPPIQRDDLSACRYCQRRFATDRLQIHEDICSRTVKKKRKVYDATKHRLAGTDLEPFAKKAAKQGKGGAPPSEVIKIAKAKPLKTSATSKSNWRQKHEEFISTIRAAKQAQAFIAKGGNIRDLPPPPPSTNPDYVQCPHCGRRFNQAAADRHIPKCATFEFNKPKPGVGRPPPPGPNRSFR